jgi:hypothetical protein
MQPFSVSNDLFFRSPEVILHLTLSGCQWRHHDGDLILPASS